MKKNAEQGQSSVSVVVTETTALSPVKPPNSNSILWIVDITPAGTPCFFSRDVKKAALEAFFFRLLEGGGGRTARPHKFPRIYLNDFWLRSSAIVPVAKVAPVWGAIAKVVENIDGFETSKNTALNIF